jgi:hypothetical protein
MSKQLPWEEHIDSLKNRLGVNPRIVYYGDPEFEELVRPYGGLRAGWNGSFLWKLYENAIVLMREGRVGTLAHEFRHAWQYKNREEEGFVFDHNEPLDAKLKLSAYAASEKEADANEFAKAYCKEYGLTLEASEVSLNMLANKVFAAPITIAKVFGK